MASQAQHLSEADLSDSCDLSDLGGGDLVGGGGVYQYPSSGLLPREVLSSVSSDEQVVSSGDVAEPLDNSGVADNNSVGVFALDDIHESFPPSPYGSLAKESGVAPIHALSMGASALLPSSRSSVGLEDMYPVTREEARMELLHNWNNNNNNNNNSSSSNNNNNNTSSNSNNVSAVKDRRDAAPSKHALSMANTQMGLATTANPKASTATPTKTKIVPPRSPLRPTANAFEATSTAATATTTTTRRVRANADAPRPSEIDALAVDAAAALAAHQRRSRRLVDRLGAVSDAVDFWEAAAHRTSGHRRLLILCRGPSALVHAAYHALHRRLSAHDTSGDGDEEMEDGGDDGAGEKPNRSRLTLSDLPWLLSTTGKLVGLVGREADETGRCGREVHRRAARLRMLRDALAWQLGEESAAAAAAVPAPERSPQEHLERLLVSLTRARHASRGVVDAATQAARESVQGDAGQFTPAHHIIAVTQVAQARGVLVPPTRPVATSWRSRFCGSLEMAVGRLFGAPNRSRSSSEPLSREKAQENDGAFAFRTHLSLTDSFAQSSEETVCSLCELWDAEADSARASAPAPALVPHSPGDETPEDDGKVDSTENLPAPPPLAVALHEARAAFALSEEAAEVAYALHAPPTRWQMYWIPLCVGAAWSASLALTLYARAGEVRQFYHFAVSATKGMFVEHIRDPLQEIYGEVLRSAGGAPARSDMATASNSASDSKYALERMLLSWAETNPVPKKSESKGLGMETTTGTSSKWLAENLESATSYVAETVGSATESVMAAAEVVTKSGSSSSTAGGDVATGATVANATGGSVGSGIGGGGSAVGGTSPHSVPHSAPSAAAPSGGSSSQAPSPKPPPSPPPPMDDIMDAMMAQYERELRNPVTSLFAGELPRMLLIQVQALKAEMEAALVSMDEVMASNRVTLAVSAMAPVGIGVITMAYGSRLLLRSLRITTDAAAGAKRARGRVRARLRAAEVSLVALGGRAAETYSPADAARLGMLTLAVHRLYGEVARAAAFGLVESQEEYSALREDIAMLADPNGDYRARLDCARRIGRLYAVAR